MLGAEGSGGEGGLFLQSPGPGREANGGAAWVRADERAAVGAGPGESGHAAFCGVIAGWPRNRPRGLGVGGDEAVVGAGPRAVLRRHGRLEVEVARPCARPPRHVMRSFAELSQDCHGAITPWRGSRWPPAPVPRARPPRHGRVTA